MNKAKRFLSLYDVFCYALYAKHISKTKFCEAFGKICFDRQQFFLTDTCCQLSQRLINVTLFLSTEHRDARKHSFQTNAVK